MLELHMHEAHLLRRQKYTVSQIAQELGCSERTVYYYLSEEPRRRKIRKYKSKLDTFKSYINSIIEDDPDFSRIELFNRLKDQGYTGGITILRDYASKVAERANRKAVIRFETLPGHQAQVDWKDVGKRDVKGVRKKVFAFTMVLGYSRSPFVVHTTSMDQATTLACHVLAFKYFGAVPHEILYDNMKTAFIRDSEGRWKANKHMLSLANHYGFIPRRCRVRRPQTKGKVERFIRTYAEGFLRYLEDGIGIEEMNQKVNSWIEGLMDKTFRDFNQTRRERLVEDLKAMHRLPLADFDVRREKTLRVSRESLVTYQTNRFSVPPKYIGMDLTLRVHPLEEIGALYHRDILVREIPRINGKQHISWRDEDRSALYNLWLSQSGPALPGKQNCESDTPVETRSPSFYDNLLPMGATA